MQWLDLRSLFAGRSCCVWFYHRFPLRLGEVQELMLACGVILSHLDEVFIKVCGNTQSERARETDEAGSFIPNNVIEIDHGWLKSHLQPMRGLEQLRCARVISAGHACSSETSAAATANLRSRT